MSAGPSVNLLLTESCPGRCPYCFNQVVQEQRLSGQATNMKIEDLLVALEFLRRSQISHVRLMGGEPLIHPHLKEVMDTIYKFSDWESVITFTGGLFQTSALQFFDTIKSSFVFNLNHPTSYINDQWRGVLKNLREAVENGFRVVLGYNIYQVFFDYDFLLTTAMEYGIDSVRVSIANPIGSIETQILRGEQRRQIGSKILELVENFISNDINVIFDCVLPLCLFSDEQYGRLAKMIDGNALRDGVCSPALDIRPDLTVHRCFAMGEDLKVSLCDYLDSRELADFFLESTDKFKWLIPADGCDNCIEYRNHRCQGDCLAFRMESICKVRYDERESTHIFQEAYLALERKEDSLALEYFERAFQIYPFNASALCDYLYLLVKHGFTSKAHELATRCKNILQTEGRCKERLIKGFIAEAIGDQQGALSHYRGSLSALSADKKQYIRSRILTLLG